jgi:hypothetical protein
VFALIIIIVFFRWSVSSSGVQLTVDVQEDNRRDLAQVWTMLNIETDDFWLNFRIVCFSNESAVRVELGNIKFSQRQETDEKYCKLRTTKSTKLNVNLNQI